MRMRKNKQHKHRELEWWERYRWGVANDTFWANTDSEFRMQALNAEQKELLTRKVESKQWASNTVAAACTLGAVASSASLPIVFAQGILPTLAAAGGAAAGLYGEVYSLKYSQKKERRYNKKRDKTVQKLLSRTADISFCSPAVKMVLPRTVLEHEVEFASEVGMSTAPAGDLLRSIGGSLPGVHTEPLKPKHRNVRVEVSPVDMLTNALFWLPNATHADFLEQAENSILDMHNATKRLPRHGGSIAHLPEGMRSTDERAKRDLLMGSLGVYGTLRAQAATHLSGVVGELFAKRGEDPLLKDAEWLATPTGENVSWDQINDIERYTRYLSA